MPPAVAYEDRSVRLASLDCAAVGVWRDPPNHARAAALRALHRRALAAPTSGPVPILHVVNAGDTSPLTLSDEHRKELGETIRVLKGSRAVLAIAFEGSTFFVASWRSILSTVLLLLRPDFPAKLFASRAEAADWLAARASGDGQPSARELLAAAGAIENGLLPP